MPERSSNDDKKPASPKREKSGGIDVNKIAARILKQATGEGAEDDGKDPAAVELGRKGGKARAAKQSSEQRRESARNASNARRNKD
ncbi:MAG: RNA-binding protein [Phycisphaeraceae bacterium]|nr:RNA-binding protein [Phycisphaeraceae bacterium]MCB9861288.1 RNA-binding protein [Phycisphaeraceae bacterium]